MAKAQATETAKVAGLKVHKLNELDAEQVQALRARPRIDFTKIFDTVRYITTNLCTLLNENYKQSCETSSNALLS